MRKLRLHKISLINFKGLNLCVEFSDHTRIYGLNGLGKSSIQEAWIWLLTGYLNPNSTKNYEIYNAKEALSHETPQTKVIAEISIDEKKHTIEKTALPKFVRKRGTDVYEKAPSDIYTYYVDNVEKSISSYKSWIQTNIIDDYELLIYCLDGSFFQYLAKNDKDQARDILERIVGVVPKEFGDKDYSAIKNEISQGTIELLLEKHQTLKKKYNSSLDEISYKIQAKNEDLAKLQSINFDQIAENIAAVRKEIYNIDNLILGKSESLKPIMGERDRIFTLINDKTIELNKSRNAYLSDFEAQKNIINEKIKNIVCINNDIAARNNTKQKERENVSRNLACLQDKLATLKEERIFLLQERDRVKSRIFTENVCSYCGQNLPSDVIETKKEFFAEVKKKEIDIIVKKGKSIREQIDNITQEIENLTTIIAEKVEFEDLNDVSQLESKLKELEKNFTVYEDTDEYKKLYSEIEKWQKQLPIIPENDIDALTQAKKELIEKIEAHNRVYGKKEDLTQLLNDIQVLKDNAKKIVQLQTESESIIQLIKEYMQDRANYISDQVNDKLSTANIVMFRQQKDGQLAQDCVITDKSGVKSVNGAMTILLNIDLQTMFCERFNLNAPVFIDECSVFSPSLEPQLDNMQTIKMFASDDKVLKIEK